MTPGNNKDTAILQWANGREARVERRSAAMELILRLRFVHH